VANQRSWALSWRERPTEEAAHFNPAFCGELIARAVHNYGNAHAAPLPLALAFLVLPLTLHPKVRRALPRKANTAFASWAGENAEILSSVPMGVLQLRPISREALLFLAQHNAVIVGPSGVSLGLAPMKLSSRITVTTPEVDDIRRAAALLGRWFAQQPSEATILQTMGVRA